MIAHALTIRTPALLATGQPMLLDIPDSEEDMRDWKLVKGDERARIRELFRCFAEMLSARNIKTGAESAAMKRHHLGWGWSAAALRKLFCAYRDGGHKPGDWRCAGPRFAAGDWRILIREYNGASNEKLPPEFKRWVAEQWAQFKGRSDVVTALWRHVVYEIWLKGEPVPGYGSVDEWCRRTGRARPHPLLVRQSELPAGWSERTFRRCLPKREVTRKQIAGGYLAAHNAQPDQVLTDRSPLLPLMYVYLDDTRPDMRLTWFGPGGRGEIVYPLVVMGLDAASAVDLEAITKPRAMKSDESGQRHGVTHDMALAVVIGVLRRFGLPPWPITFVHENAAACIPSHARHALADAYGERIQFLPTSIFKERMIESGFADQGGAPWDKAPIESFWRILATQLARLPGSTGPRYDTAPGELKQIETYTLGLMEKAGGLAEVFAKFRSPLLDFKEGDEAIMSALRLLRFRTRHELQGFDRIKEFRRTPAEGYRPWSEFVMLPIAEQNAIATGGDKDAIISRLESPAERFCRLLQGVELTAVDDDLLTWVQGPREQVRVLNGKITAGRVEHGDDRLIFRETNHPLLDEEHEGRTFEGVIAADGERIVLTDEGRILGSVARQGRIARNDLDAIRREQGRIRAARVADREHLRGYYLADAETALAELRAHNEAVDVTTAIDSTRRPEIETAPTRQRAKEQRRATLDAEIAAAERDTGAVSAPTTGSLYDASSDAQADL